MNQESGIKNQTLKLFTEKYHASEGTEYFLSYESADRKTLYAFTRLRFPSKDTKNQLPVLRNMLRNGVAIWGWIHILYGQW